MSTTRPVLSRNVSLAALLAVSSILGGTSSAFADGSVSGSAEAEVHVHVSAQVAIEGRADGGVHAGDWGPVGMEAHGMEAHGVEARATTAAGRRRGFRGDHWEAAIGVQGAMSTAIGPIEAHEPWGLRLAAGRQLGSVRLAGEFSILGFEGCLGREWVEGQLHRVGAAARYRLPVNGDTDLFGRPETDSFGFYVGGGVGRQSIRYRGGGHSARTDAMVEAGFEFAVGGARFAGFEFGLRLEAAGRPPVPVEMPHGSQALVEDHTVDIAAIGTMAVLLGG